MAKSKLPTDNSTNDQDNTEQPDSPASVRQTGSATGESRGPALDENDNNLIPGSEDQSYPNTRAKGMDA